LKSYQSLSLSLQLAEVFEIFSRLHLKYLTFVATKNLTKSAGQREKRNEELNTSIQAGRAGTVALARAAVGIGNVFSSLIHPVS
jgi:hypothetical protein